MKNDTKPETKSQKLARAAQLADEGQQDAALELLKECARSTRGRVVGDSFSAKVGMANGTPFVRLPLKAYQGVSKGDTVDIHLGEDTITVSAPKKVTTVHLVTDKNAA